MEHGIHVYDRQGIVHIRSELAPPGATSLCARYYSDPEQEFLKGNCTCIRPLDDAVELTFDVWNSLHEDSQTTSSSGAALQV